MELYLKPTTLPYNPENGRFLPGHKTWNKGKKGISIGGEETRFKPGHLPHNTRHDGCITVRYHKRNNTHSKYIRIAKGKWQLYSRYIYEQAYGPIPAGHIIYFKDGDTMNCELSNLGCMSNADNMRRNRNRQKAAESMRQIWARTRARHKLGLAPITKWGERMDRKLINKNN